MRRSIVLCRGNKQHIIGTMVLPSVTLQPTRQWRLPQQHNNNVKICTPILLIANHCYYICIVYVCVFVFSKQGGPWLQSWADRLCNLQCEKSCFRFIDTQGDGDCSIVVALRNERLKVFKGTVMAHDISIPGVPVSICDFYVAQVKAN
jgi:hypothetical protein